MNRLAAFSVAFLVGTPAWADFEVRFIEGAPKDRFVIKNVGSCDVGPGKLAIDLSGSSAGLVFDVTAKGAGVEVFQPFELVSGKSNLTSMPTVKDGDTRVELALMQLAAGDTIQFTIDVDDTLGGREITVSNSEIEGANVSFVSKGQSSSGTFTSASFATVKNATCSS